MTPYVCSHSRNPPRLFGVLRHDQRHGAIPGYFTERSDAEYMVGCNFAFWAGRCTIKLRKPLPLKLRGQSCAIREETIIAAIEGSPYHQSLIEAWR